MASLPHLLIVTCIAIFSIAHGFEHFAQHTPCSLCIYARWTYLGLAASLMAAIHISRHFPRWTKVAYGLSTFFAFFGSGLSLFHSALERKWIAVSLGCTSDITLSTSLEALRDRLYDTAIGRCDELGWTFLGFSLANFNTLLFLGLFVGCITLVQRNECGQKR